ncbi:E3 ubiquitin-protein ligase rnf213-alpha [Geodia barretti]|uniref:E3 ubiquitin-protein ligase rnf213-alpha n=1 Tax=Geodia barretti TaxID=519541 RepID=A0AA35R4D6_GEOBA|nr:E3 ubiquitin-protein ligase rnf213-alpha [Geodia barretti]
MATILNDDKQEHDPLYYLVYERAPMVKDSLEPHLWGYRPRITLEHLTRYLQQQKKFPILEEFLKNEPVLQATQYIPDIVRLQKQLFDELHHRINHKVAHTVSIHDFILRQHTKSVQSQYLEMVSSVQNAWALVRDQLKDHGHLKVDEKYLQEHLGLDTTLEYFIPTTTGPGACTFSLLHYLCYVHNNYIDWCRAKSNTRSWREHKIQLAHIHKCHLLDYQSQLQSILLSHCHYSLRVGQSQEVSMTSQLWRNVSWTALSMGNLLFWSISLMSTTRRTSTLHQHLLL